MIKRRRFPRIFFGWWTAFAGGIIALWSVGFHVYGFSALLKPIASELGFSRAAVSVPASIGRFEGGLEGPVTGYITDRFGPRWVILSGIFIISLGLILMYFVDSLWAFYLAWGIIVGTGVNLAQTIPTDTAITNWFVKKRGLALGIRRGFGGLGGVVVLPLITWLIITQGWRKTCVIGGIAMGLVGLPLAWFGFKRHRPEYYGLLPDGATVEGEAAGTSQMVGEGVKYAAEVQEVEFTLRQALRTPAYWLLIGGEALYGMVASATTVHLVPFLTDTGIESVKAAGMVAIMVAIGTPFRFLGGTVSDRLKRGHLRFLFAGAYGIKAVGFAVFLLQPTPTMLWVWTILYGIGHGLGIIIGVVMVPRYFGRKAYGSIRGSSVLVHTPLGIAAPIYAGWVYDTTGNYLTAFTVFTVTLVIAAVVVLLASPPKPPAQITDIHKIL